MNRKKLMLLGGIRYLLPAIEAAHKHGYHVITVDYLPDNIAHRYSDEYHNVSIIDKEAVLQLAQKLQIDGILSFAVDPGVVTAAYVAEKNAQIKDIPIIDVSKPGFRESKEYRALVTLGKEYNEGSLVWRDKFDKYVLALY